MNQKGAQSPEHSRFLPIFSSSIFHSQLNFKTRILRFPSLPFLSSIKKKRSRGLCTCLDLYRLYPTYLSRVMCIKSVRFFFCFAMSSILRCSRYLLPNHKIENKSKENLGLLFCMFIHLHSLPRESYDLCIFFQRNDRKGRKIKRIGSNSKRA